MKIGFFPRFSALGTAHFLFVGVFLFRLFALARLSASPFLLPSGGDMYFYNDWAQRILRGEADSAFAFYGLPGYAYLLAFLYKAFGYSPFIPGFLQAVLEGGTAVLIYQIALHCLGFLAQPPVATHSPTQKALVLNARLLAAIAALGWAFFVPAQAYSIILMPTTWLVFVFWLIVWRLTVKETAPTGKEYFLFGLLIAVTAMSVATILFLIPLLLAALFVRPGSDRSWRRILSGAAFLLLGALMGTSPAWIHNYVVARDPVFLSAHGGVNFWIGNNPEANGYPRFPPGLRAGQAAMLEDSITSAESAAGHSLKRAEVSAYWSGKAKDYIVHHFSQWLGLLLIKLRNFWSAFQYDDLSIITSLRESGVILPGFYFGIVAALALPGMVIAWRLVPVTRWITAAILLHMTAVLSVFITERYRLPIVPGLLVFAAFGLAVFWQNCLTREYRAALFYLALLGCSAASVSWPQRNPALWALDAYNSGLQAMEANDLSRAEEKLAVAHAYVPNNAETNFALGNLRLAQNHRERAKTFYLEALRIEPEHKGAANNLGVIALDSGKFSEALSWFQRTLAAAPQDPKTHYLLARTWSAAGNDAAAGQEIEKAIALSPNQSEFISLRDKLRRLNH